jgi:hypothetical protein
MIGSTKSFARTASNLHRSIHQKLNMFALAAVVAVVSLLALTEPAQANIVYTPAHVVIWGGFRDYHLDLNHDGITDFYIVCFRCLNGYGTLLASPAAGNGVVGSGKDASALSPGAQIGSAETFITAQAEMEEEVSYRCSTGNWCNVTNGYLGLKFMIMGKPHYGWARLSVYVNRSGLNATLTGYAYETIPGKSIIAGQTKAAADDPTNEDFGPGASLTNPIPDKTQPASLGTLALGAQGVPPLWRRNQEMETARYRRVVSAN